MKPRHSVELVEAVAECLAEQQNAGKPAWADLVPPGRELWRVNAEAVLTVVRSRTVPYVVDEAALFAALHEYRRCSEDQARGIIAEYLRALSPPVDELDS